MMRTVLSALLGLVAVLLLLGGITATAVQRTVVDQDGFVAVTSSLAADAGLRDRLAITLATEATNRVDLPDGLRDAAAGIIERGAVALGEDPAFPGAWQESMRRSHDLTLTSLTDPDRTDVLQADVQPLVALLVGRVAGSLGVPEGGSLVGGDPVVLDVGQPAQAQLAANAVRLTGDAPAALVGAAVAGILALLLAHRRSTTLAWLGLGVLAGTGLLTLVGVLVRTAVAGDADAPGLTDHLRYRLVEVAAGAAVPWLAGLAIWGAVLLAAGIVGRIIVGRRPAGSAQR